MFFFSFVGFVVCSFGLETVSSSSGSPRNSHLTEDGLRPHHVQFYRGPGMEFITSSLMRAKHVGTLFPLLFALIWQYILYNFLLFNHIFSDSIYTDLLQMRILHFFEIMYTQLRISHAYCYNVLNDILEIVFSLSMYSSETIASLVPTVFQQQLHLLPLARCE